jgi:hypothetical protein
MKLALLILTVAGVAGQSCCTGTSDPSKGTFPAAAGACKAPDSAYSWTMKTCDAPTTCRSYKCTVSTAGITWSSLVYQDCFNDATYQAAMTANSINSYKCTSGAAGIKGSLTAIFLALATVVSVVSVISSTHT